MPAAIYATKEIGLPVLATTLSLLAVFLPVAFMSSIPGRFLRSFGLTMGAAILISLLVSFTLTPMLSSRLLRLPPEGGRRKSLLERFTDAFYGPVERVYMAMLRFALRHRWVVVVAALLTSLFSVVGLSGARARFARLPLVAQGVAVALLVVALDALGPRGIAPLVYFEV